ncbi:hypothetical protein Taro_013070 [Colocasia esculenta]|uniref:Uncharacterized protein n=1 Tax=Colocasia esculenta TaxID=4460 RepID=A0A843U5P2_COLES|nr:hypothetical protein [Colocasia esculenta]
MLPGRDVATSDGVATALLTDVTGVLSVRTALSGVMRTCVNATWAPVAITFPVFEVRLLSSGRARVGRRRRGGNVDHSPSGSLDPWAATAKIGSSAWAEGRVLGSLQSSQTMAVTVVYFVSCLTLTRRGGETSQQRQGVRRAEETGR